MKKFNNRSGDAPKKPRGDKKESGKRSSYAKKKDSTDKIPEEKTEYKGRGRNQKPIFGKVEDKERKKKPFKKPFSPLKGGKNKTDEQQPVYNLKTIQKTTQTDADEIRLNKFIANAGICSRRDADKLIENGEISVNGKVVNEMGYKVLRKDRVVYKGKSIRPEKPVYILLNKPKDFITTTDDPFERKTVMHLVDNACEERLFPVGRLDRNTTGLLLFTNDGELSAKLTHPSYEIKKIYQVTLDKAIAKNDVDAILEGVTLEDGITEVDDLQVLSKDRTILGIEIHSGKNRIVRRIFAHFGYEVIALDRVTFAGLSKKDIPRGKYRFLEEKEVINLKFMNKRKNKKRPK
ncbi:pseudouridine synthase [Cyclobacterium marinum]|uniref:Pseudouridine synthase n=1 Tax=Cyclobacterium marinum (strain ATCC 25205 / DSM 745 / LMG 13164 / NCIMB 1802) TaxID=880070 RepID=G0IZI9_CYCMS|nr:pseudouridine synthase [Cyclobacterium marinum]AEL25030.1 pseudouridine synthase Rsu [Cyclobacterium marinum DSM 745]MBI0401501.1 rRNA pseudouridine synthase [Cyclobacterium marinum]